jgi:hypothetical protein
MARLCSAAPLMGVFVEAEPGRVDKARSPSAIKGRVERSSNAEHSALPAGRFYTRSA